MNSKSSIPLLLKEFPAFAAQVDVDDEEYYILGEFAIYLRDGIVNSTFESEELAHAFRFLNRMGASNDSEVQNQLVVGVLEILADTDQSIQVVRMHLEDRALELFERTLRGWKN